MRWFILAAIVLCGCVDHDAIDRREWSRSKTNADRADACIKSGGMPRQGFFNENVESCLIPIDKITRAP
jgi:hypothetical protein